MNIYKVWIQIEEIDENRDHYLNIGLPYEAGKFETKAEAARLRLSHLLLKFTTRSERFHNLRYSLLLVNCFL